MSWFLACSVPTSYEFATEVKVPVPYTAPPDTGVVVAAGDSDAPPPVDTGSAADPVAPRLLLNEVVAKNDSTWDGGDGTWPDWVEIYNASDEAIELATVALRDSSELTWIGPPGTLLPGERYVVVASGTVDAGTQHAPFKLDGDGDERLVLSVEGVVSDRLSVGSVPRDTAWARLPDGGAWGITVHTTAGASNPATAGDSLDPTDLVFQLDEVVPIEITLSDAAINSLRASRLSWVDGSVTFPEGTFPDVQVRLKAYVGSSRTIDQKCGFKVDLNEYEDRRWHGVETLTLNNMVQDVTYVHEYMAYTLYRALGVPAPRQGYAWVTVNGQDYGLYLIMESIDDRFLDRWYADPTGPLFEGAYGVDLYSGYENSFEYDEGPDSSDRSDLTELIAVLDQGASESNLVELEAIFDMDEFLRNMAVEAVSLHWDGYTTRNNYRLYRDPSTGKFTIIPWGTDQTFLTAYYGPWSALGRVFQWCLDVQSCADRYDAILLEATYTMDALDLGTLGSDLAADLRPYMELDPRKEFSMSTHDYYLAATVASVASYPQSVRDQLAAR